MTVPVVRLPLTVAGGRFVTVDQASDVDVAQSVALLVATRAGERRSVPGYGLDDPLFASRGLREAEIRDAIDEWEPRAEVTGVEISTGPNGATEAVTVWTRPYDDEEYD